MAHDPRVVKNEDQIEELRKTVPEWIKRLQRPITPAVVPAFGPLEGVRVVSTGVIIAQPYIGTKLPAVRRRGHSCRTAGRRHVSRLALFLTRGPRIHGCDKAEMMRNKLSMGLDLKQARAIELLMALWKISDVWMNVGAWHI